MHQNHIYLCKSVIKNIVKLGEMQLFFNTQLHLVGGGMYEGQVQALRLEWKKVKVAQLCPTLCDPMNYTVRGILQARSLEWVAFPFSRGSSQPRDWTQVSLIAGRFFTSWATREDQEYWSGQPIPSPGDLSAQESNPGLPHCRRILYQLGHKGSPGWAA